MTASVFAPRDERPLRAVPPFVWWLFIAALGAQWLFAQTHPRPRPDAASLASPPGKAAVAVLSMGDMLAAAKLMNLVLQAHDNQPGLSIPLVRLDYDRVIAWLERILEMDPAGPYPLIAAARLYAEVPDPVRTRQMLEFVHRRFHDAPNRHWQALAHAAHLARHRLHDNDLARRFAASLAREAKGPDVPAWARQMEVLLVADLNETESARVLLGALLDSGQVRDDAEYRFLARRIEEGTPGAPAQTPR